MLLHLKAHIHFYTHILHTFLYSYFTYISILLSIYVLYSNVNYIYIYIPNQPHLLNKYQIYMGFSHFHEFGILSGMFILAPHQIDIVKGCGFCNRSIILIWFFFKLIIWFWKMNNIYLIFYFLHIFVRKLIIICVYDFGNKRNTQKFAAIQIEHRPTQIR